ncbi:Guanine nucleotide-binding protein G(k) subunit alpha [Lobulomyces angularis]|nr:Guanine nucleotide-binding protein G(k) subunit alpha [Lobulomyces angularis]
MEENKINLDENSSKLSIQMKEIEVKNSDTKSEISKAISSSSRGSVNSGISSSSKSTRLSVNFGELLDTEEVGVNFVRDLLLSPRKAITRNRMIDKQLKLDERQFKEEAQKTARILVLGSGDSGKSTFIRQMRLLNEDSFNQTEIDNFHNTIIDNLISSLKNLILGTEKLGINTTTEDYINDVQHLLDYEWLSTDYLVSPITAATIKRIWSDKNLKLCFSRKSELKDIICSRKSTTTISETKVKYRDKKFLIIDVGGQKNYRHQWIPFFDNVHTIIFLVAISSFDQMLEEEENVNRIKDSLDLFDKIINNALLANIDFILIFNKMDLFKAKLKSSQIKLHFEDFNEDQTDTKKCAQYFLNLFQSRSKREVQYVQYTTSTNMQKMKQVITSICDIILRRVLKRAGLV